MPVEIEIQNFRNIDTIDICYLDSDLSVNIKKQKHEKGLRPTVLWKDNKTEYFRQKYHEDNILKTCICGKQIYHRQEYKHNKTKEHNTRLDTLGIVIDEDELKKKKELKQEQVQRNKQIKLDREKRSLDRLYRKENCREVDFLCAEDFEDA